MENKMSKIKIFMSFFLCIVSLKANHTWEKTDFLWNFGLIQQCNKGLNKSPYDLFSTHFIFDKNAYQNIKTGDIVWIKPAFLQEFYDQILSTLKVPIVLLIADGDESFPSNCNLTIPIKQILDNPLIIHVFAQNNDYTGPSNKVSSVPIGIDFHTLAYQQNQQNWGKKSSPQEQETELKNLLKTLQPTNQRKKRAYVDFQYNDSMHGSFNRYLECGEDRTLIFEILLDSGLIDYGPWMTRSDLWRKKSEYAFSISPHGNGLDCHRTWEDLLLGCIVIVKTSSLDCLYKGLPIIIINEWSEITEDNFDKWLTLYGDAFTNPEYRKKLTNDYWFDIIRLKCPVSTSPSGL